MRASLIGLVAVLSVGLGLIAVWISGYPYGFMAMIGTAGLIDVAINDSIVELASIRANTSAAGGDPRAVADAFHTTANASISRPAISSSVTPTAVETAHGSAM